MARRRTRTLDLNLPLMEEFEEEEEDASEYKDLIDILEFERSRRIDLDINAVPVSDRSVIRIDREEDEVSIYSYVNHSMPDPQVLNLFPRNPGVLGRNQERGFDSLQLGLGLQSWFDSSSEGSVVLGESSSSPIMIMDEVDLEVGQGQGQPSAGEGSWFDQGMGDIEVTEQMVHLDQGDLDWNIECAEALAMIIDNDEDRVSLLHEEADTFDAVFNGESMSWEFDSEFSHFISLFAELPHDFELEQLPDIETVVNHSVPTAEHVIENLPSVTLTQDDVKRNNAVCSICTDEFSADEKLKRLPCSHIYHGDCILPWLNIQNTCPVCRYKLPTR